MWRKYKGYGVQESYAGYGLTESRAKTLIKECRAGKHADILQKAAQQANPDIAKWIISSIAGGKSLRDMEFEWACGKTDLMPCCRNSFYAYRKCTLAMLDNILSGQETVWKQKQTKIDI